MKITLIHGPNLNLLGQRDVQQYGPLQLKDIQDLLVHQFPSIDFEFYQSNIEGEIIDMIQRCIRDNQPLIINPGGYSHTSVAMRDALEILQAPKIEVHLSNIHSREEFRHQSLTGSVCNGIIMGLKENGYPLAVQAILQLL
jgi:3-dehydroquinate dehydratase-2